MDRKTYNAALEGFKQHPPLVFTCNGRSAWTKEQLDFMVEAEKNTVLDSDEEARFEKMYSRAKVAEPAAPVQTAEIPDASQTTDETKPDEQLTLEVPDAVGEVKLTPEQVAEAENAKVAEPAAPKPATKPKPARMKPSRPRPTKVKPAKGS